MKSANRFLSLLLSVIMVINMIPMHAHAAEADENLTAALSEAESYTNAITVNNSSNDPSTVVSQFGTHFTWDNEKRESSKSYLFDWSYYNGVVFEGIEYLYEVTGNTTYKDYVVEYMSSLIAANGTWATCSNNSSKQCAGYNSTHGADCYKTASLLLDTYEMTGDSRYLTMAATLYADLDSAANSYSLKNAGNNYRHTWASDPSPDLWLDGLYMILPFRAEYAKYIGDQEELDLIVSRMQWVSDNMYNSSKGLFYHAADSASSNSGTYWLRSIGWYAAAIVDIMDSMEGSNLEAMKVQLVKLVDGMKACQNTSNGMWLNNMNASQSSSNPYETSGTALVCYAVMKAVNNGWLDESYADMAILAFKGICNEKLSGTTLTDICFKGVPGSSNSTFYDNEGKGVGPFIMLYAEVLEYVNSQEEEPEVTEPEVTEPEVTEPEVTEPEVTEPEVTEPEPSEPEENEATYTGTGYLEGDTVYTLDSNGIDSGEKYLIVYSGKALQNNNGVDANPSVTVSNNTITLADDSALAWTITLSSGSNYYVENNGSYLNLSSSGNDPIGSSRTVYISLSGSKYTFRNASGSGAYLRYSSSQLFCAGTNNSNNGMYLYRRSSAGNGSQVVFTLSPSANVVNIGSALALNGTVTVDGKTVNLSSCTVTWSSSNTAAATVSNGTVTGVAAGNATITATLSAVNGTALKDNIVLTVPVTVQGHDYKAVITPATCTENGYTTYTCSICGDSYVADEVNATGHDYESVTTEATCTENGSIVYTCHCGDSYTEVITAQGHKHTAAVTAPTCTEEGYTTFTCACGDSYVANKVAALGHDYETETIHATCTEDGSIVYTCHCGDSYSEVIEAAGHTYQAVITAPTCTEEGYTTYTCGSCSDSYTADYVDAMGHNYEVVTVEPTCTENGSITTTCSICGESSVEQIEAIGHTYYAVVTDPTCIEEGYTTHTCYTCGHSYNDSFVAALGHYVVSVVTDPTCTTKGYTVHTCTVCDEAYIDSYVDALGHDYDAVTTDATCTEDGSIVYTCHCGKTYSEVIEATGHTYETVTVDPTCTETGSITYTCHCGDSYSEVIEATGHTHEAVVTAPTCTENGYTTYICYCGDTYVADEVAALGHTYESVTTAATCTENGFVVFTCNCGESYTEIITAPGHQYEAVVTAPTCEDDGYTTYICQCGDSYTADTVAALGHMYEAVVTAPTCVDAGYTTYTCHCGESYTDDEVEALGHTYESVVTAPTCETAGYTTYTCHCGESYTADETDALGHDYQSVTTDPGCTENGSTVFTCYCGDTYTEVIPALGHNYEGVVTDPTCTENGYTTYTCHCGESYVADEVPATGHSYETVEQNGMLVHTCGSCGNSYTESVAWIALPKQYVLDTDGIDIGAEHKYIVVGADKNYALTVSGTTVGSAAVTVSNDTITLNDPTNFEFYFVNNNTMESGSYLLTQEGSKYIYHMGGNMYYGTDNKGYWHMGSNSNGSYQLYDNDNQKWYLNYGYVWGSESVSRFAVSSTARYIRLFKATEPFARLSGDCIQTYAHEAGATVDTIIGKLAIQLSKDGTNVTDTLAVTADMISWDKAFEGFTAGVYTGHVICQGIELGTVTVTVTGEHTYATSHTEATCTTAGLTVKLCTACGHLVEEEVTPALGHDYVCVEENGYLVYTCTRCGDTYSEKVSAYTQVNAISAGNDYVITLYSGSKYYALSHAGNNITVVQINVSNGEITSEITDDLLWTYSNNKMSYVSNGSTYYMYCYTNSWWGGWWGSSGTSLQLSTTNSSTVTFSSNKVKVGSYYLKYSSGSVKLNSSATTAYIFTEN